MTTTATITTDGAAVTTADDGTGCENDPNSHQANLRRVRRRIATLVVQFCADRLTLGMPEFHMAELDAYIREHFDGHVAPESSGRILRDAAARGAVVYSLVSRAKSLYRAVAVTPHLLDTPRTKS